MKTTVQQGLIKRMLGQTLSHTISTVSLFDPELNGLSSPTPCLHWVVATWECLGRKVYQATHYRCVYYTNVEEFSGAGDMA